MKTKLLVLFGALCAVSSRADVIMLPASQDASIVAGNPNNSNGGGPCFFSGTDGNSSPHRALISFNLSSIPSGSTITSVQLTLTLAQVAGSGGGGGGQIAKTATIGLYDLTRSWGEGTVESDAFGIGGTGQGDAANPGDATWNAAFYQQASWNSPGGDHASAASESLFMNNNAAGTVYTYPSNAQLVADVQGWLNNPATNFGWELINADETSQRTFFAFFSREWHTFTGGNAAQEPVLQVTYTPPTIVPVPAAAEWGTLAAVLIVSLRVLYRREQMRP
jgi:hypothetical protein